MAQSLTKIAIISDIHSNLEALRTVLEEIEKLKIQEVWCLGDLTGYGPDPNKCCQLAQEKFTVCLLGNHDQGVLDATQDWRFNPYAKEALTWTRKVIEEKNKDFLRKLKSKDLPSTEAGELFIRGCATLASLGRRLAPRPKGLGTSPCSRCNKATLNNYLLVHGSPRSPCWEYILEEEAAAQNFKNFDQPICFFGHTHIPIVLQETLKRKKAQKIKIKNNIKYLINPGSVGQPRDYDPRASFLVFDKKKNILELRRLAYPLEKTQKKMEKASLPRVLIERLSFGY